MIMLPAMYTYTSYCLLFMILALPFHHLSTLECFYSSMCVYTQHSDCCEWPVTEDPIGSVKVLLTCNFTHICTYGKDTVNIVTSPVVTEGSEGLLFLLLGYIVFRKAVLSLVNEQPLVIYLPDRSYVFVCELSQIYIHVCTYMYV